MKAQETSARQLQEDARLLAKYRGRSVRTFVKVRNRDAFRLNPILARIEAAKKRIEAAGVAAVIVGKLAD